MVTWIAKGKKSLISTMCMASRWTGMWMRIFSEWYMKQEKESGTWTSNIMAALSFRIIVMQLKATTKIFQTHLIPPVGRLCRGLGVTYLNEVDVDCGSGCDVVATAVSNRWRNSWNSCREKFIILTIVFVIWTVAVFQSQAIHYNYRSMNPWWTIKVATQAGSLLRPQTV